MSRAGEQSHLIYLPDLGGSFFIKGLWEKGLLKGNNKELYDQLSQ